MRERQTKKERDGERQVEKKRERERKRETERDREGERENIIVFRFLLKLNLPSLTGFTYSRVR